MLQYALYTTPGGSLLADYSARAQDVQIASNARGFAECTAFIPMSLADAFQLYERPGLPHVVVTDGATARAFEGRLEDVDIVDGGVNLTALGYSRALSDVPYVAFWSGTNVKEWVPFANSAISRVPTMYTMDQNDRVFIGLTKNTVYRNAIDIGAQYLQVPDDSSRNIVGLTCQFSMVLPANWKFEIYSWTAGFGSSTLQYSTTGGTLTGVNVITFTAAPILEFVIYNATGASYTYTGETGVNYVQLTNMRWVSSTANQISTAFTAARAAGTNVTATVGSTSGMYVGQTLYVGAGEAVTVLSIGSSTQFNATFTQNQVIGGAVRAFLIYADEVAKHLISTTNFANSTQLSSSTQLVQSPATDLLNESYEDQYPADVLDYLIGLGDSAGRQWEWGVYEDRRLFFRPRGSAGRTWYIDASSIDVSRTLDSMHNSVYPVYEVNGVTVRGVYSTDTTSVSRYGVTRQLALKVNTNSSIQAGIQRDTALADQKNPIPRSQVDVTQVFDGYGNRWPIYMVRAGDTIIIRNLSPVLSTTADRIRSFVVNRATYDVDADTLTLEPDLPRARLDTLLAQLAAGVGPTLGIGLNIPKGATTAKSKGGSRQT